MAEKLKLEPAAPIIFAAPYQKAQTTHQATNVSANRIMTKVKCSDAETIQVSPVFAVIEPNQTIPFKFRFADSAPNPAKKYMYGIVIADAPADLANDVKKIKDAWADVKDGATIKLACEFREQAPAAAATAEATPAEAIFAEAPAAEEPPAQ